MHHADWACWALPSRSITDSRHENTGYNPAVPPPLIPSWERVIR
jgi:hypothetical protein